MFAGMCCRDAHEICKKRHTDLSTMRKGRKGQIFLALLRVRKLRLSLLSAQAGDSITSTRVVGLA